MFGNMKYSKVYFLLFLLSIGFSGRAQDFPDIEELLESNGIENSEEGYEEIINTLLFLVSRPIDINTAGFDTLKLLLLLSDSQIDQILIFREKHGCFLHLNELLWVPGIGPQDLANILPFVTLGHSVSSSDTIYHKSRLKHEFLTKVRMNLPRQEGYIIYSPAEFEKEKDYIRKADSRFHGPPFGSLVKYKFIHENQLQVGITLENDPGEGYFTSNQRTGFDFLSAHIKIETKHIFRQIILGDYRVQWGQGLIAWGGFASGKSGVAVGNEKSGKGFAPYTSADENNYLRGIAFAVKPSDDLTAELFFSRKRTDGNITAMDTLAEEDFLTVSLYESGYHRNNTECSKKHALKELTTGVALHWNTSLFKVGVNALYYDFTPALIPGGRTYQQYNDSGTKRWLASVDYKTAYRGIYVFGETAVSDAGAWATLNGLRMSTSFMSGCLVYRRYDKHYISRYAGGFGEYSNTSNEEGLYCGVELMPFKKWKLNLYYDRFHFFGPRYLATIPGNGWELLAEATYNGTKAAHILRYKQEVKPEDINGTTVQKQKSEYRYQFNYHFRACWEFRSRLNMCTYHKDVMKEWGYMIFQDVIYTTRKANFKMQCRLAWFDTDSYQSRIYAYENNVLYGYSFPSFMGKGWRTYLNLTWKPVKGLTCYLKSGFIIYPERDAISSGVTKIEGNKQYDLTFQIRVTF